MAKQNDTPTRISDVQDALATPLLDGEAEQLMALAIKQRRRWLAKTEMKKKPEEPTQ